jgi:hypothetical protein
MECIVNTKWSSVTMECIVNTEWSSVTMECIVNTKWSSVTMQCIVNTEWSSVTMECATVQMTHCIVATLEMLCTRVSEARVAACTYELHFALNAIV